MRPGHPAAPYRWRRGRSQVGDGWQSARNSPPSLSWRSMSNKLLVQPPVDRGGNALRMAPHQFGCGHSRAGSPLGLKRWSHQSNVSWVGHEVGGWRRAASPQSYAALCRSGLAVLQMCCRRTRGQSLKTQSPQGADRKGVYSKHQSSRQTLCSAMDFSILSAFCRRDLSA